jgi:hypothetical protein
MPPPCQSSAQLLGFRHSCAHFVQSPGSGSAAKDRPGSMAQALQRGGWRRLRGRNSSSTNAHRCSLRGEPMTDTTFSHQKANSPAAHYTDGGLRSFFVYRDTGVTPATNGRLRVQLVRAAHKSSEAKGGTGFHFHTADIHVVYMIRGWAKFDYDGVELGSTPATACISGQGSYTTSSTGPTIWSSWRSSCRLILPLPRSRLRRRSRH